MPGGTERRPCERQTLQGLVSTLLEGQIAVRQQQVSPVKGVADSDYCLPGELGGAGSGVQIVGYEPFPFAEPGPATKADDAVPQIHGLSCRAGAAWQAVHVTGEIPI